MPWRLLSAIAAVAFCFGVYGIILVYFPQWVFIGAMVVFGFVGAHVLVMHRKGVNPGPVDVTVNTDIGVSGLPSVLGHPPMPAVEPSAVPVEEPEDEDVRGPRVLEL